MYDSPVPSLIVSAVFGIIGVAVVLAVVLIIIDHVEPIVERLLGGASFTEWLGNKLGDKVRLFRRRHRADQDEDPDLDASAESLLSILPSASLIVDRQGDVVRANPQAYRLGIVQDDSIVEPAVIKAVRDVREHGGRRRFDLETETPERFVPPLPSGAGIQVDTESNGVRRPNWLKVTVGRVDARFVVVLIDDVSETVRFSQIRDSFIVNVSEQLLSPTEALSRLADELERDDVDPAKVRADAGRVRVASNHLNHMVSDLLLLIKAQEPIVPSAANRLNVMEQLAVVSSQLARTAADEDIQLRLDGDRSLVVNGEADQIRTAVTKLVENAIVYSKRGGYVALSAQKDDSGQYAVIRVLDQGKGIAKSEQRRIFERFYRGKDQTERSADGVGLGLSIVKHVALTHHGTVAVWSAPGQGSTFTLSLPLAQ
ncbi:ATPase [Bifidobacterium sp. MA2]|uniref:Sensor-like histidine kinase SenX3 n=1 Tax=Bifidobacterium santillanense TaxID=2809028 RepID=A0ABS5UNW0_9BIFI|nr:ATP-binding protein [Bifidobacterium santillanense]MBT1172553.1 ATPase [Bifidobacterium santillanense]